MTRVAMTGTERFVRVLTDAPIMVADQSAFTHAMWDWLTHLQQMLEQHLPAAGALRTDSAPARQIHALQALSAEILQAAAEQWRGQAAAREVSASFDGQLMLLVFGKFNAGKSALCNFLAAHLAPYGWKAAYCHLEGGQLVESDRGFAEGATETTARLQCVVVGERMVLLDTPGLHSVTDEHAALTLRYTDSADAILWLSNSASPGQVQALDALAHELMRHKPLLPIITRSDTIDEDEVDGEICKVLINKTPGNRALQEQDVRDRTAAKLIQLGADVDLLRPPVSVSVHMARQAAGGDLAALEQAGIERLFDALADLAESALAYKQRKHAEVLLHHLQEQVQAGIAQRLSVALAALQEALLAECERLRAGPAAIGKAVWRCVMPQVPDWIAQHRPFSPAQLQALAGRLAAAFQASLQVEVARQLAPWRADLIPAVVPACDPADLLGVVTEAAPEMMEERLYVRMRESVQCGLDAAVIAPLLQDCLDRALSLHQDCASLAKQLQEHARILSGIGRQLRQAEPGIH